MKAVKRNLEVEAYQFDSQSLELMNMLVSRGFIYNTTEIEGIIQICDNGVNVEVKNGDYIIIDPDNNFHALTAERFNFLYRSEEENHAKKGKKKNILEPTDLTWSLCLSGMLMFCFILSIFISYTVIKKNMANTIIEVNKEEIERKSNEKLEEAKILAMEIIEDAKKQAQIEADNAFIAEMERLTNSQIKKGKSK